jgi:DUF4097 and DUF4098 domain-containing protein YvlB
MKNKLVIVLILIAALGVVCVAIALIGALMYFPTASRTVQIIGNQQALNVSAQAVEEHSFTVTGQAMLNLNNYFGDIDIQAESSGPGGEIQVSAQKQAWGVDQNAADAALEKLKIDMTQDSNNVTIQVQAPETNNLINQNRASKVDFNISVPPTTTVVVHTRNGDISLAGTQGKADLNSDFGEINISDVKGGVAATSLNGKINVRRIQLLDSGFGDATLNTGFGDLTLEDAIVQQANLSSRNGTVTLTNVNSDGELNVSSDFGEIVINSAQGSNLQAGTRNGAITLTDIGLDKKVSAQSDFGDLKLTRVQAQEYDLNTKSGAVSADGVQGSLKAQTDFGEINISNADKANIDLETNSGKINYRGSLGPGPHRLSTNFGDIRLTLPEDSSFNFDLQTDFGTIRIGFQINITGQPDDKHWQGQVNGGGPSVKASSRNGDISIDAFTP